MGPSGISFGSLLLIALIIFVFFGKGRMQNIINDLTKAIKGFKSGLSENDQEPKDV